jgi:hypothetical protein
VPARPIRLEAADAADHTVAGEGLTRLARDADRLVVGHGVGTHALRHDDGCAVYAFSLGPGTGAVLCEAHGRERRATVEGEDANGTDGTGETDGTDGTDGTGETDRTDGTDATDVTDATVETDERGGGR